MKNQRLLLASMIAASLSFVAAGCILGSDPNENSMVFGALGGNTGTAGTGTTGAGGGGGSGSSSLDTTNPPGLLLASFDTTIESFAFSTYDESTNLAVHNNGTAPTITWDAADGSPTSMLGSLKVTAPYGGANQYVDIQSLTFPTNMLRNWMGGRLHVRVKVDAGSTFTGQIEPYVDTTSTFAFVGSSINVMNGGGWKDYSFALDSAMTHNAGYDTKQVVLFGVHIGSGGGGATQGSVTFHIDSFSIEGIAAPPTPDAATD